MKAPTTLGFEDEEYHEAIDMLIVRLDSRKYWVAVSSLPSTPSKWTVIFYKRGDAYKTIHQDDLLMVAALIKDEEEWLASQGHIPRP